MIKKMLKDIYYSELSKKLGVFRHPMILKIQYILKKMKIYIRNRKSLNEIQDIVNGKKELDNEYLGNNTNQLLRDISIVNPKLWAAFLDKIHTTNFKRLKDKEKVNVAFLCNLSATWSCDELFQKYLKSEKYHPYVVVTHFYNGTPTTIEEAVHKTYEWFKNKGYEVYTDYDYELKKFNTLEDLLDPDILFHLSPYYTAFHENWNVLNFPLSKININIPYGIYVAELSEAQYNLDSFSAYWRIFDLPIYARMAPKHTPLGNANRVGSGYCKLDVLYDPNINCSEELIWKKLSPEAVKIIYAPHHSIGEMGQRFSTFDKNYDVIYQLASEMRQTTSWVLKPHPLLEKATVEAGLFANENEYKEYLRKWEDLPNATVITGGDYFDLFKSSDAMILDSDSFLAEYLFVNKPMLLLSRPTQQFSELGKPLSKVLYKTGGEDIQGIKAFVENVVIDEKDNLLEDRNTFFDNYLNYYKENNVLATEYIYDYVHSCLEQ